MSRSTINLVLVTWSIIIAAILQHIVKKLVALYGNHFNKDSLSKAVAMGFVASFLAQLVAIGSMGFELTSFIVGLLIGTLVFGAAIIVAKFLVAVSKDAILYIYTSIKLWWAVDVKRIKAQRTLRNVA